jgi:hypothetical protein
MLYTWICILATTLVINTVFVFSLLATLTWDERAMFLFATALLAGGLLFTIRTMRRLTGR